MRFRCKNHSGRRPVFFVCQKIIHGIIDIYWKHIPPFSQGHSLICRSLLDAPACLATGLTHRFQCIQMAIAPCEGRAFERENASRWHSILSNHKDKNMVYQNACVYRNRGDTVFISLGFFGGVYRWLICKSKRKTASFIRLRSLWIPVVPCLDSIIGVIQWKRPH